MIEFEALENLHPHGRAERFMFVGEDGKTWANITSVDGRKLWRMTLVGFTERQQPDSNDYDAAMRRALAPTRAAGSCTVSCRGAAATTRPSASRKDGSSSPVTPPIPLRPPADTASIPVSAT